MTFFTITVDNNSKDDIKFIIDSGVSQYISPLEHLFDNLNTSSKQVLTAEKNILNVKGEGNIRLKVQCGNQ